MKTFKKYLREFSGDDLPPAGPKYKVFRHKVYQLTEYQNPDEDYDDQYISHQYENEHIHDLGDVVLPTNNVNEANEILRKRFDDFHLATCLSHTHNYPENAEFRGVTQNFPSIDSLQDHSEAFAVHHHGDGRHHESGYPDISQSYAHYIEPKEETPETQH